ncbi:MAG: L-threonine 3-dehydrogenase [candidate division WOR-3 bacterium]|nr:L-threonine 3-dehydrogenase [candidate division WOR-3 bacterium]
MIAIAKTKPSYGFDIIKAEIPKINEYEVLIEVKYASICGSDVHAYVWDDWAKETITEFPRVLGHEIAGVIVEKGKHVNSLNIGDFVAIESHFWCNVCYNCKNGDFHVCKNTKILGFGVDGGFANYLKIPYTNAIKVPDNIPRHWISLMEPMGNAVDTVLSDEIAGKNVLIVGCGPIGLMAVGISKICGANKVIAMDINEHRLKISKEMGADYIINPKTENVYEKVMEITDNVGVDVVLEFSGSEVGFKEAMKTIKEAGRLSLLGLYSKPFEFDFNKYFIMKGLKIYGIIGRKIYSTWYKTISLIQKMNLDPIISHVLKLEEFEKGFEDILNGRAIKVVFKVS